MRLSAIVNWMRILSFLLSNALNLFLRPRAGMSFLFFGINSSFPSEEVFLFGLNLGSNMHILCATLWSVTLPITDVLIDKAVILVNKWTADITGEVEVAILKFGGSSTRSNCPHCRTQYWPHWSFKYKTCVLGPGRSGLECTLDFF